MFAIFLTPSHDLTMNIVLRSIGHPLKMSTKIRQPSLLFEKTCVHVHGPAFLMLWPGHMYILHTVIMAGWVQ